MRIADVGTGTGRAAIGLRKAGAEVIGLDASIEMLGVARLRAAEAGVSLTLGVADGHQLPLRDGAVDAAVCLRVLMHAIDWRQCIGELCRVSRRRVVVDFPAALSFAAIESRLRAQRRKQGRAVEAYRVIAERDMAAVFASHGYRIVSVRRQFVLPIAFHKSLGRFGLTRRLERLLAGAGLLRLLGSPVTMVAER
jgi:ubiquinone/menaquinone biosynthesis C-methylase UbiE